MLTAEEKKKEEEIREKEKKKKYGVAAGDWEATATQYEALGKEGCCYFCEAGRAYLNAAEDNRAAGNNAAADADLDKAAEAYRQCGEFCFEQADFTCAEDGMYTAELLYRRIAKNKLAAGDGAGAKTATGHADDIDKQKEALKKIKAERDKEEKEHQAAKK